MKRWVLALVLLTGCMSSFRLTRSVYAFNTRLSDSVVVQEIVFVAFLIVPVYEVSLVADLLFLNVAETVTGDSLIRTVPPQSEARALPDGRVVAAIPDPGEDGVWIEVSGQRARRVVRRGGTLALLEGGVPVSTVLPGPDGSLTVVDRDGRARQIDGDAVEGALRAAGRGGDALARHVRVTMEAEKAENRVISSP